MTNLKDINKDIVFEPISHTYTRIDGKKFISVSHLIDLYKPEFDPDGHIKRAVAKKRGITVQEVSDEWSKIAKDACDRGHDCHSQIEHFIKTGEILDSTYKDVVEHFAKFKFTGRLLSEIKLHSPSYFFSGTADLLEVFDDNTIILLDFKTNKRIEKLSKYGNKLLYPLDKYEDSEIGRYTIQLNLYKYMLEEHGYKVKDIILLWINPESRDFQKFKIKSVQKDIKILLEHYKNSLVW